MYFNTASGKVVSCSKQESCNDFPSSDNGRLHKSNALWISFLLPHRSMHERSMADKTRRKDQEAGLTSECDDGAQSWSLALRMVRPGVDAGNLHAESADCNQ